MKNNRRITLSSPTIKEHTLSTESPPENSLFWKMWNASLDIADAALATPFIQGIKNGTLNPVTYGAFNISDAYYCFHGADDYLTASNKATDKVLKAFLQKKHQSYQSYNETFPQTWRIKNAEGIVPTETCKAYSDFESTVAANEMPIYMLIVMLPCEYLWGWLAGQLLPIKSDNLYAAWINDNNSTKGAYAMGNFLCDYQKKYPIDEEKAMELYIQAMHFEQQNFATATT